jgi:hypothetical protein
MKTNKPPYRKLRGYAFDPSLSQQAETAGINTIIYKVMWENLFNEEADLNLDNAKFQGPGPVGEYLEVVDYDPTIQQFYEPVDLNSNSILAQDGLAPSESNPQFHQQMVYAVAMTTIKHFEKALGRKVMWSPRRVLDSTVYEEYVQRLRIYPHALRDANAYYSPQKKALLFGYFSSTPADASLQMPGSLVFTCLSHDIITHETTHAIIDGMHKHYNNPSNPDVLAFHEAFADIVALFQHFTFPEVLKKQIAETRGDLSAQNQLGKLAQQFGTAIGNYGSLRDAIGDLDKVTGTWTPKKPNASDYTEVMEPHARGSILVAAVFDVFIKIYKNQVADLLRIASNGTGILPQGEIHPDLVNRLALEASKSASHVLQMCIRALDYCPPVDITFGDFLRAIITADVDLVADDSRNYRLYFIDAFRKRGIYPQGIKTLSVESLRYEHMPKVSKDMTTLFGYIVEFLQGFRRDIMYVTDRKAINDITREYMGGRDNNLHRRILRKFSGSNEFEKLTGLTYGGDWFKLGVKTSKHNPDLPSFQIVNLRLINRVGPDNREVCQIIFSIIQKAGVIKQSDDTLKTYDLNNKKPENGLEFFGGCTLIFDLATLDLKYAISKPLLDTNLLKANKKEINKTRVLNQYEFQHNMEMNMNEFNCCFGESLSEANEPFALLHKH